MIRHLFRKKRQPRLRLNLHETFTDSGAKNFLVSHGEGRLRYAVTRRHIYLLAAILMLAVIYTIFRVGMLQIAAGDTYRYISENNTFIRVPVLAVRGDIHDRNGTALAWNTGDIINDIPARNYLAPGFSTLLGFVRYPKKDSSDNYYRQKTEGEGGLEEMYDLELSGKNGSFILEKDAKGETVSERFIEEASDGEDIVTSIDADVQKFLYQSIKKTVNQVGFRAGSGVLLNSNTGEIIALTSYPEFDNNLLTNTPESAGEGGENGIFVSRAVSGLYSPGSTIKPFFAVAALEENVVSPHTIIVSNGYITVQNPYDSSIVYTYKDWKVHGPLDIYGALAHSSNVYFYHVGGGYERQAGLGIDRLKTYASIFGYGAPTRLGIFHEPAGLVPSREWKESVYDEDWRVGDTYNTVIGQYAFQVTPLQMARASAALVNGGYLVEPHLIAHEEGEKISLAISEETLSIVRRGMRKTITEGTAKELANDAYNLAVKTGTAQVGRGGFVHSLLIGFFPYENPQYTFAIVMEYGKRGGGAISAAKLFFDSMRLYAPSYMQQ